MKNIKVYYALILFLLYMFICFLMPTIINGNTENLISNNDEIISNKNDKYLQGEKIKLLLTDSNQVIEMEFEDYIKGVLIGEMPVAYELNALKAQAVVARTYTLYKMKNATSKHDNGADMCDDINCCQAFKTKEYAFASWDDNDENEKWSKINTAVDDTSGEVIVYSGELINAFFHANSGGKTENVKYIWSKAEIPYLVSVDGNEVEIFQDSKTFTKEEFKNLINSKVPNYKNDSKIVIENYTGSGRVNNLKIDDVDIEATLLRSLIGIRSTNFRIEEDGENITFYTVGYGHGVGMSQDGANQMAHDGADYKEIIKHYYTGVDIVKMTM